MEKSEYQNIFDHELKHWWYQSLHQLVLSVLRKHHRGDQVLRLLDAGCGSGGFLKTLLETRPAGWQIFGLDLSLHALNYSKARKLERLIQGSVSSLPFPDQSFDAVTSLDVLYCQEVKEDLLTLQEFFRVLTPGGLLVLNLPAYEFLRGKHDQVIHTRRRYTASEVRQLLKESCFSVEILTYRCSFTLPGVFAVRLVNKLARLLQLNNNPPTSDVAKSPHLLNVILKSLLSVENAILKQIPLPCGSSVFAVARKPTLSSTQLS